MIDHPSRRHIVLGVPGLSVVAAVLHGVPVSWVLAGESAAEPGSPPWPEFPRQNPSVVQEVVGTAHFNEKRVRELVDAQPALANAWWDWGFGDWESPLGAASHTGRRTIAEYLLERGARVDIFAATMLGHLDVVKAMTAARPGVQRTLGPHGIPLLDHAEVGGDAAKGVAEFLRSLGDAGTRTKSMTLPESQAETYVGSFSFGTGEKNVLYVKNEKTRLVIEKQGEAKRNLFFVGDHEFHPAGAPSVRIRFEVSEGKAASLTIVDGAPIVKANRIP